MNRSAGTKVWLWVGAGCAVILILGVAVVGFFVANLFRSPEVRSFIGDMSEMQRVEKLAPILVQAMKTYSAEQSDFPPNLEALAPYLTEEEMKATTEAFTYAKPEPDAPRNQVILHSRTFRLPGGGEMQIIVQKDLEAYSLTKSPLKPDFSGWNTNREQRQN